MSDSDDVPAPKSRRRLQSFSSSSSEEKQPLRRRSASVGRKLVEHSEDISDKVAELNIHLNKDVTGLVSSFFDEFNGEEREIDTSEKNKIVHLDSVRGIVYYVRPVKEHYYFVSLNIYSEEEKEVKLNINRNKVSLHKVLLSMKGNLLLFYDRTRKTCLFFDIRSGALLSKIKLDNIPNYVSMKIINIIGKDIIILMEDGHGVDTYDVISINMEKETLNFIKRVVGKYVGSNEDNKLIFYSGKSFIIIS